ncbi:hypothetical protein [Anaerosporobacter sp.]|uniref:hypothetical protein n=1 Tax=Anaerosporobacter sp. TaxID=1872529 RepID=UPI00286F88AE|nr:hypothetical protein [Anaerosporobacter sp.]
MKRQGTEKEWQLLKNSRKDIISGALELQKGNEVLPSILGFIFGLAIGIPVILALGTTNKLAIRVLYTVCVVLGFNIFLFVWRKVLGVNRKRNVFHTGFFEINGGTIVNIVSDGETESILFLEDDLLDDWKRPYLIRFPAKNLGNLKPGDRILLVYGSDEVYVPMRINEQTKELIQSASPINFAEVEWKRLQEIPHPSVIELEGTPRLLNENGKREFARKWKSAYSVGKKIAMVLLGALFFMIMAIVFCVMVADDVIREESFIGAIVVFVLVWMLLTCFMVYLIRCTDKRVIRKVTHQQTVMFCSFYSNYDGHVYTAQLNVYEREGDKFVFNTYNTYNNVKLPKGTSYGTLISKYTGEKFLHFTK